MTTGSADSNEEFWWDELERLLLSPGKLPGELSLNISGTTHAWQLGQDASWNKSDYGRTRHWNVLEINNPTKRHALYRSLSQLIRPLDIDTQKDIINKLRDWTQLGNSGRQTYQTLSSNEIIKLSEGNLIDVGAHTASHAVLSALSQERQEVEIVKSKVYLEQILGRKVSTFSYPFGTLMDYSPVTTGLVKNAGFSNACSNVAGLIHKVPDIYQLPRFLVRNWDSKAFAAFFQRWIKG